MHGQVDDTNSSRHRDESITDTAGADREPVYTASFDLTEKMLRRALWRSHGQLIGSALILMCAVVLIAVVALMGDRGLSEIPMFTWLALLGGIVVGAPWCHRYRVHMTAAKAVQQWGSGRAILTMTAKGAELKVHGTTFSFDWETMKGFRAQRKYVFIHPPGTSPWVVPTERLPDGAVAFLTAKLNKETNEVAQQDAPAASEPDVRPEADSSPTSSYVVRTSLTEEMIREASWKHFLRVERILAFAGLALLLGVVLYLWVGEYFDGPHIGVPVLVGGSAAAMLLGLVILIRSGARRACQAGGCPGAVFSFTEDGVESRASGTTASRGWGDFSLVERTDRFLYLFIDRQIIWFLPISQVPEDAYRFIIGKLREAGVPVR